MTDVNESERQQAQRDLIERAHECPGVADVAEAYGAISENIPVTSVAGKDGVAYATGGNC